MDFLKQNSVIKDLALRFFLGGGAIVACYIILQIIPWKSFAGIFAAFPAVMVAAVIMTGIFEGSRQAADVALGATAGMLGCTVCVLIAILCMFYLENWAMSLVIATIAWFFSSLVSIQIIQGLIKKSKG
jgi:hypothetical protein